MTSGRLPSHRVIAGFTLVLAASTLAACGSEKGNPPPVEPTDSPPLNQKPAGKVLELGGEAEGVAVDSADGLAAIAFREPNRLEIVDVDAKRQIASVQTPDPSRHLEMANDGTTLLVPVEYDDELLQIDLSQFADTRLARPGAGKPPRVPLDSVDPDSIKTADFPHDATQADNGTIFVGDEGGDVITVIRDGKVTGQLDAPEQPGGVASSGNLLAAGAVAARELAFYDTDTLQQIAVIDAGAGPSHVVAGPDSRFYVADTGGDAVLVVDGAPDGGGDPRLVDRANVPDSPYGMAVDLKRDRLFVTRTGANRVDEIDISTPAPHITDVFPTVRQPNTLAVDQRTGDVVVVGRTGGEVQIFNPDDERGAGR